MQVIFNCWRAKDDCRPHDRLGVVPRKSPLFHQRACCSLSPETLHQDLVIEHDHGTNTLTPRQHRETIVDFIEPDAARNQFVQFKAPVELLVNQPWKIAHGPRIAIT